MMGDLAPALPSRLDHLVLATPDLDATAEWLAHATGVEPSVGGPHPGMGTRNRLCAFSDHTYLEIIGPDPEQQDPLGPRPFDVDTLTSAALVAWCATSSDLSHTVSVAARAGHDLVGPLAMSRQSPEGLLSWDLAVPADPAADRCIPFFIDWKQSQHPASVAAGGLRLASFRAEHPEPPVATLVALGVDLVVEVGPSIRLVARVAGPGGAVELPTVPAPSPPPATP